MYISKKVSLALVCFVLSFEFGHFFPKNNDRKSLFFLTRFLVGEMNHQEKVDVHCLITVTSQFEGGGET